MTYPDDPTALAEPDIFKAVGKDADALRDRLAAIGMQWYHRCQNDRIKQERQWYLNLAFMSGNQNVQFRQTTSGAFDLYVPKAPYYRVRIVINQIRKIVRKEISRLTAQKPNAFVIPASTEDADVFAAQAGEQIWDSLWRRLKLNKTLRDAIFWQAVCGNGFLKSYWDPTKIDTSTTKDPTTMPPGADLKTYGDIVIEKVSPFHIFVPDQMQTDLEEQPYLIHAQVRSNSWIRQVFGEEAVPNNKLDEVDEQLRNVLQVNTNDNKRDQSIILEIWVKPGYLPELPDGGMFTIASEKVVQGQMGWPYEHGQYPFQKLDGIYTGKFYSASIIEDLIPLQQELNRSRSQLIESKNKMSKPQLLAEEGSVDAKKITTEPGQVILYKLGHSPPQPLPLQNLPSYVTEEINRLYDDMADISGQHEVSNGSTPPGVTAATAISFLQEQDESLIAGAYTSIEEAVEKMASQALVYVKMYWDEERTVKIVGLDGTFDAQVFAGSDLRGNADIRVEAGSALPTSRAAKQAFIMDLMKMGFIAPDEGLEILEVGGLDRIYDRIQIDKRQAQRENLKMRVITVQDMQQHQEQWDQKVQEQPSLGTDVDTGLKLDPPPIIEVHTYDNHEIHIEVHNNYRKSQNFESATPEVKALFEQHVMDHMEASMGAFTGQLPVDPNALPDPNAPDAQDAPPQDSGGQSSGPDPMPQLSDQGGQQA